MSGTSPAKFLTAESCGDETQSTIRIEVKDRSDNDIISRQMWRIQDGRIYSMCDRVENDRVEQAIYVGDVLSNSGREAKLQNSDSSNASVFKFKTAEGSTAGEIRASIVFSSHDASNTIVDFNLVETDQNYAAFCKY